MIVFVDDWARMSTIIYGGDVYTFRQPPGSPKWWYSDKDAVMHPAVLDRAKKLGGWKP